MKKDIKSYRKTPLQAILLFVSFLTLITAHSFGSVFASNQTGSINDPHGNVVLSDEDAADWAHWGLSSASSLASSSKSVTIPFWAPEPSAAFQTRAQPIHGLTAPPQQALRITQRAYANTSEM